MLATRNGETVGLIAVVILVAHCSFPSHAMYMRFRRTFVALLVYENAATTGYAVAICRA